MESLFTLKMLAEFLELPISTLRLWIRHGLIIPTAKIRRLAYFDFQEVLTGKTLRDLHREGLNVSEMKKRIHQIRQIDVIVEGKDVLLRKDKRLVDYKAQTRMDFIELEFPPDEQDQEHWEPSQFLDSAFYANSPSAETLCEIALVLESEGKLQEALDTYRAALFAGGPNAETCFHVAEILYRLGDLTAARERYYIALEIDEEYVEARANLSCLLDELGEWELAISAFQGAIAYHPDYAEVHYHLGTVLWRHDRKEEARQHLQTFLELQSDSPRAEKARQMISRK